MSGASKKLMGTTAAGGGFTAIEDVFSTYLYTGNDTAQTISNGIDLAGEGGLVWTKSRTLTYNNTVGDTENGVNLYLYTNTTVGHTDPTPAYISAYNSDGYSIGSVGGGFVANELGASGVNYASWTFRKAPRFFDVVTYTGDGSATRDIAHGLDCEVGSVIIKRTDASANWFVYERTSTGNYTVLLLNTTDSGFALSASYNPTTTTFSAVTPNGDHNVSGATYVAYLFAHDPLGPSGDGSDGLIACGSYAGADHRSQELVDLGWEPQWVLIKNATDNSALGDTDWVMVDTMRGMSHTSEASLYANLSSAEFTSVDDRVAPDPQGFRFIGADRDLNRNGDTYIYIAIRRGPMRAPESGTEVFGVAKTSVASPTITTGFPTDLHLFKTTDIVQGTYWAARLTNKALISSETSGEGNAFNLFDSNTTVPTSVGSTGYAQYDFRRAPGFFDVVTYTADGSGGRQIPHNLGVVPELMIAKRRNGTGGWTTYVSALGATNYLELHSTIASTSSVNAWNNTAPTASEFSIGSFLNFETNPYIAYLFASLDGVSKVGSYTGDGTGNRVIDCGFTTGARFLIIKRTDGTGNWSVWDTERGIVAGAADARLELNTTDAEENTDNHIDPDPSGFKIISIFNTSGASYIFYAIA